MTARRNQSSLLRFSGPAAITILIGPVVFGLAATLLPAFGFFPPLGGYSLSFSSFVTLFERPGLFQSVTISFLTAIITALISLFSVTLFIAGWSGTAIFHKLQHVISPLLSVPHAAAAFGLAFLIAPSGWILRFISPELTGFDRPPDWLIIHDSNAITMMFGLIIKEIPFLLLVSLAALPQTNAQKKTQLVRSLGYGRVIGFMHTVWPEIYRQIRLPVYAVIAYSSAVVDVAIILGPNAPAPLSPRLLGWMNDPDLTMRFEASAGAVLQLMITMGAIIAWWVGERICSHILRLFSYTGLRAKSDGLLRFFGLGWMVVSASTVFMGLLVLAIWSIAGFWSFPDILPDSFTLKNWMRSIPSLGRPLANSLLIGTLATLIAIIVALACLEYESRSGLRRGKGAMLIIYLPLLIPQTAFVFGLQIFFLWSGLDTSLAALVLVHLIFVFPYVLLSMSEPWHAWDDRYRNIAHGFGSGDNRIFWFIRFPMLIRPVLVAMAVGFAVSIGQYLPTILIGAGRQPTITTEAVALAAGGNRRIIGVYAFLQMLLPFIAFMLASAIPALLFRNRQDMKAA